MNKEIKKAAWKRLRTITELLEKGVISKAQADEKLGEILDMVQEYYEKYKKSNIEYIAELERIIRRNNGKY